jgi:hypothetical protein
VGAPWEGPAELGVLDHGKKRVLSVGRSLDPQTRAAITGAGCELFEVPSVSEALREMLTSLYDVVVVQASVMRKLDGLRFVRQLKNQESNSDFMNFRGLRHIYDSVPFLVPPLEGTSEYAVFEASDVWYLADTTEVSLGDAILRATELS